MTAPAPSVAELQARSLDRLLTLRACRAPARPGPGPGRGGVGGQQAGGSIECIIHCGARHPHAGVEWGSKCGVRNEATLQFRPDMICGHCASSASRRWRTAAPVIHEPPPNHIRKTKTPTSEPFEQDFETSLARALLHIAGQL